MNARVNKILVLDDDYESMFDLKAHLEEELGWSVELSANKSILERLRVESFDIIVLDLMIRPVSLDSNNQEVQNIHYEGIHWTQTGLEFLRRFRNGDYTLDNRSTPSNIPVLILSAVANNTVGRDREKLLLKENYTEKPFRLADLVKKMQFLLSEWQKA
jgi:CheY-like chemotaxis protein